MNTAVAPEIDRLVWAVADRVRDRHRSGELPGLDILSVPALSRTLNLVQYVYPDIGEDLIRRRYVYASDEQMAQYFEEIVDLGLFERVGGRLRPTTNLPPILAAFDEAILESSRTHWQDHPEVVESLVPLARRVLEACPEPDVLMTRALNGPEADDRCQLVYQRLAALRLMRNEAHVRAWRAQGLGPREVEVLTSAWAGSKTQGSAEPTTLMIERGLADDGVVAAAGLELRQEIEDETNAGVAPAFASVDQELFLDELRRLPGPLD